MKTILALILTLAAFTASASETITLAPMDCGLNVQCNAIPNDVGSAISLSAAYGQKTAYLYIDGVTYSGSNALNIGYVFQSAAFQAVDGATVLLTATFTTATTCTRSGRGQHCSKHWYLVSGSIAR